MAVGAAVAMGLSLAPATATPAGTPTPTSAPAATARTADSALRIDGLAPGRHAITLVTGDRVLLDSTEGGRFTVSVDQLGPRPDGAHVDSIAVTAGRDGVFAVPDDVRPAVDAGVLDRRLFDLAYLAEHGLTDATSKRLPLIVQYGTATAFGAADALPASTATRPLTSIGGAAVSVPKASVGQFWTAVRGATASTEVTTLSRGVKRIWLDGTAELSLDVSVPLIGAPDAWAAGLDGTGTTVAVLDTGVDLNHPDLAGQLAGTESFLSGETVQDTHGHGTHVATTIAGTGAASDGRYRGVAPGAKLLAGKVCNDGGCPDSAIIAGMEWATANGADVVSLSLGGDPTDGSDPLSQAVNALTAASGALFVIAAGNAGPQASTVATPAAADAALAVAATTKSDGMASFSSRGPRVDGALKPDIAAPGANIVAGRAAGTTMGTPVNDSYTSANGTSMATPHVSGAAAILAQRFPDWESGQLKAALMSTSKDLGFTVFDAGAGRVDLTRATSQQVFAGTPNVDFGNVDPSQNPDPIDREITYTNVGDTPVTLTVRRSLRSTGGDTVPGDVFTGEDTVTVPAGGSTTTTITLDVDPLGPGRYTGSVVATDEASGTRLTVPVGVVRQAPQVTLTIRVIARDGAAPCSACVSIGLVAVDVPDVANVRARRVGLGVYQAQVQPGTYSVHGRMRWTNPTTSVASHAYLIDPQVEVAGPTEITLDGRTANKITTRVPESAARFNQTVTVSRSAWDGELRTSVHVGGLTWGQADLYAAPTERAETGVFRFDVARMLANEQVGMRLLGRDGFDLRLLHRGYSDQGKRVIGGESWVPWQATRRWVELVDVGYARPADLAGLNLRGKLAVMRWGDDRDGLGGGPADGNPDSAIWTDRVRALREAGATGYLAVSTPPAGWERSASFSVPTSFIMRPTEDAPENIELPEVQIPRDQGLELLRRLDRGRQWVELTVDPDIRRTYQVYPVYEQRIPESLDQSVRSRELATVRTSFHGEPDPVRSSFSVFGPGQGFGGGTHLTSFGPSQRTDYYGPVTARATLMRNQWISDTRYWQSVTAFDRAERTTERWFAPVTAPGAINLGPGYDHQNPDSKYAFYLCHMCREGNLLWPITVDGAGDGTRFHLGMRIGGTRLFREDGTEIPLTPVGEAYGMPAYELPAEAGRYRMEFQHQNNRTTWTFRSAPPTRDTFMPGGGCTLHQQGIDQHCEQQPVIFLGYELGDRLGLDNKVRAGGRHEFTVFAYHPRAREAMPRIAGLRVWTSTDDGATWTASRVKRDRDGGYSVAAHYPRLSRTTGAVSLKVEAWDADGNRVEQVIDRAFALD